jgi:hypothetical protein
LKHLAIRLPQLAARVQPALFTTQIIIVTASAIKCQRRENNVTHKLKLHYDIRSPEKSYGKCENTILQKPFDITGCRP